jgi:hypothetical protein
MATVTDDPGDDGTTWLCTCGHFEESAFHCPACGAEPPWGCPGECCQSPEGEGDEEYGEPEYDPYSDYGGESGGA